MVAHADDQDGTAPFVVAAVTILAGGVYFGNHFLLFGDEIWTVILIPLDPVGPHLDDFLLLELAGHREPSYGIDVGVEVFLFGDGGVVLAEDVHEFLLEGLDLR